MVFSGPWGLYIHIPKCGGEMVRTKLEHKYGIQVGEELKGVHENAIGLDGDKWTVVREPHMWLRSYFTYMGQNGWVWVGFPQYWFERFGGHPHNLPFGAWAKKVIGEKPGIVGEFFDWYLQDDVKWYRIEDPELYEFLECENRMMHVTQGKPDFSPGLIDEIKEAEKETYERFGYE